MCSIDKELKEKMLNSFKEFVKIWNLSVPEGIDVEVKLSEYDIIIRHYRTEGVANKYDLELIIRIGPNVEFERPVLFQTVQKKKNIPKKDYGIIVRPSSRISENNIKIKVNTNIDGAPEIIFIPRQKDLFQTGSFYLLSNIQQYPSRNINKHLLKHSLTLQEGLHKKIKISVIKSLISNELLSIKGQKLDNLINDIRYSIKCICDGKPIDKDSVKKAKNKKKKNQGKKKA